MLKGAAVGMVGIKESRLVKHRTVIGLPGCEPATLLHTRPHATRCHGSSAREASATGLDGRYQTARRKRVCKVQCKESIFAGSDDTAMRSSGCTTALAWAPRRTVLCWWWPSAALGHVGWRMQDGGILALPLDVALLRAMGAERDPRPAQSSRTATETRSLARAGSYRELCAAQSLKCLYPAAVPLAVCLLWPVIAALSLTGNLFFPPPLCVSRRPSRLTLHTTLYPTTRSAFRGGFSRQARRGVWTKLHLHSPPLQLDPGRAAPWPTQQDLLSSLPALLLHDSSKGRPLSSTSCSCK